jgi:hypothetical protein
MLPRVAESGRSKMIGYPRRMEICKNVQTRLEIPSQYSPCAKRDTEAAESARNMLIDRKHGKPYRRAKHARKVLPCVERESENTHGLFPSQENMDSSKGIRKHTWTFPVAGKTWTLPVAGKTSPSCVANGPHRKLNVDSTKIGMTPPAG